MKKAAVLRIAVAVGALLVALVSASAARAAFAPGTPGSGDPFFPLAGNGGYDVSHYGLTLDYTPSTNRLVGTDVITARATQDLSRFDLDLRGFTITQLLVNGVDGDVLARRPGADRHAEDGDPRRARRSP